MFITTVIKIITTISDVLTKINKHLLYYCVLPCANILTLSIHSAILVVITLTLICNFKIVITINSVLSHFSYLFNLFYGYFQ